MNLTRQIALSTLSLLMLALAPVGAAWAQVLVSSADPSSAAQGTVSLDVTINGSGFDNSAAVKFLVTGTADTGGITVKRVNVRSAKRMIVTIDVADTAIVNKFDIEVTLSDGRKGKGTTLFAVLRKTNDPCAVADITFPAFTYRQANATTGTILVADATGKCSRQLFLVSVGVQTPRFSYPVAGTTNRGRVIWRDGAQVLGGDFTVIGTTVVVEPVRTILPSVDCCVLDLSPQGDYLYVSATQSTLERVSVADPTNRTLIKTIADDGWFVNGSVNGRESALYVEERRASGTQIIGRELVRIDLSTLLSTLLVPDRVNPLYPAADPASNRIVYTDPVAGSNNCNLLQIADGTTGSTFSYGQPRYGTHSSWYGGKVLTNGYKPAKGGGLRCDRLDMVTEIDPATSAETPLVRGYDPDGR